MDGEIGIRAYPDKFFDLAIVDPPYGIGVEKKQIGFSGKNRKYHVGEWDHKIPSAEYFRELFRVSKNQIIWGANYFFSLLPPTKCVIFWDKWNSNKGRFADGELAWTSFDRPSRFVTAPWLRWYQPDTKNPEKRIHPTQKPIALYKWLVSEYYSGDGVILDTHVGSASSLIAFSAMGIEYVGYEMDPIHFRAAKKRIAAGVQKELI